MRVAEVAMIRLGSKACVAFALSVSCQAIPAQSAVLITQREAKLPSDDTVTRGVFVGPKIVIVSPPKEAGSVRSPVDLVIQFQPRGGVAIDLNSLTVTYMKTPPVDLTERVKEFMTPTGIKMPSAELPPGRHTIQIEVKDADGRTGGRELVLDVAQ